MRDRLVELLYRAHHNASCVMNEGGSEEEILEEEARYLLKYGAILPPCKVGDTVWFELYGQIESAVIYHCTCELSRKGCFLSGAYAKDTRGLELSFNENSIGKTVFLTREEAEQALKGEKT